ncbi:MAG TPA: protein kinase [Pirellulales bacterium]|jgi:serine/threonine-protein kinase|nr:protein kinase [Pirellulales bacterium]
MSQGTPPPAEAPSADLSGRHLGDFCLLRLLGSGAMAEVYLATQQSLRRQVAVKVLKPQLSGDATFVARFHNEAQSAAALVHANIVQIFEVGFQDGLHFIAQEYVAGQNLRDLVERRGPLEPQLAVLIARQVALALEKAAACGIVHRDIKPENIMITREGEVKVADFGLARLSGASELNLTQVGVTMGTPLYMSPEQVEGRRVDPRSDLYSFGVTCYQMLAGEPPFKGDTALSVAIQHLQNPPRRLEELRPELPAGLCRIVHTLLAKDPGQRYQTARELLADLRSLAIVPAEDDWWRQLEIDEQLQPAPASRTHATQQLAAVMKTEALAIVRRRRRRGLIAAALVAAFLVGGAAARWMRQPYLLADARPPTVPREQSADSQFFFAQLQATDRDAWLKSVAEYFPQSTFYVARSHQELALYYLQQNRLPEALELFRALAATPLSQPDLRGRRGPNPGAGTSTLSARSLRAFGLAGESIVLTLQGHHEQSARLLAELAPLRSDLDPRLSRLMLYPLAANRRVLDEKQAKEWDDWTHRLPHDEPTGSIDPAPADRPPADRMPIDRVPVDSGPAVR